MRKMNPGREPFRICLLIQPNLGENWLDLIGKPGKGSQYLFSSLTLSSDFLDMKPLSSLRSNFPCFLFLAQVVCNAMVHLEPVLPRICLAHYNLGAIQYLRGQDEVGGGGQKCLFLPTLRVYKLSTQQGGGAKMAKFCPRSCLMTPCGLCYQHLKMP